MLAEKEDIRATVQKADARFNPRPEEKNMLSKGRDKATQPILFSDFWQQNFFSRILKNIFLHFFTALLQNIWTKII